MNTYKFTTTHLGKSVALYALKNQNGMQVSLTNFGLKLVTLTVPDRYGKFDDVVLGFSSIKEYLDTDEVYFGAIIGRHCNRIANSIFHLNGETYTLTANKDPHHLHGGPFGFHNVVWDVLQYSETDIEFSYLSPSGEEGYPGTLRVKVRYTLTENNSLRIQYNATTDTPTIVNLTHHSYFNLAGEGTVSISDHELCIPAMHYTPVTEALIPKGIYHPVANTPFDFRQFKPIGQDIDVQHEQLQYGNGYDHHFVLKQTTDIVKERILAAEVIEPKSGRMLTIHTTEPGVQFYTGNFLNGKTLGKSQKPYPFRSAFCLETQHPPDAPNQPNFPNTVLLPGESYTSETLYTFSTVN